MVTVVPEIAFTCPRAKVSPDAPAGGEKFAPGEKLGRGLAPPAPPRPPPPKPVAVQEPLVGALRVTDVAVIVPSAPLLPVAVMQSPAVMSATVSVAVWVIVVVEP